MALTRAVCVLIALQAAMPISDMATSTAAFGLIRFVEPTSQIIISSIYIEHIYRMIGGTLGLSAGNTIYTSELTKKLSLIPGYTFSSGVDLTTNVRGLSHIEVCKIGLHREPVEFRVDI